VFWTVPGAGVPVEVEVVELLEPVLPELLDPVLPELVLELDDPELPELEPDDVEAEAPTQFVGGVGVPPPIVRGAQAGDPTTEPVNIRFTQLLSEKM
jgi:hypothetical protein